MKASSFQKTKKIIATTLVVCFLLIGLYVAFFYYLTSLNNEVADLKSKVAENKAAKEERRLAEQTLQQTADNKSRLEDIFIGSDQEDTVGFIGLLKDLATSTAKVNLDDASLSSRREPLPGPKNSKVEYLVVQATVQGSFSNVYHYLTLLESYPKGISVRQAEVEAVSGDPKKAREWQLSFVLKALKVK